MPFGTKFLIGAFTLSGVVHFVKPDTFYALIPPFIGSALFWTLLSGAFELICAWGLWKQKWWAPRLTIIVLAVVWVGNWWYAISQLVIGWSVVAAIALLRLPLQIPMFIWAKNSPVKQ